MNRSRERAFEILRTYLRNIEGMEFIRSVILVGSLSDGTYTGNAGSDIDLIHIINNEYDYYKGKKQIFELTGQTERETGNDIPIARCVYGEQHLKKPYLWDFKLSAENKDLMQLPVEVLRILDSGVTVYGEDMTVGIEAPEREDVKMSAVMNARFMETLKGSEWYEGYIKMINDPTVRILTQSVITAAMSDYYFYTGKSCSGKYRILECMEKDMPELCYMKLLRLCHKYRFSPDDITEDDVETMKCEYKSRFLTRPAAWLK